MPDNYVTTDLNVAAYLIYCGIEPTDLTLQPRFAVKKVVFYFNAERAKPVVEDFFREPSPMVDLHRYNNCRAEAVKLANKEKNNGNER